LAVGSLNGEIRLYKSVG
jgi:hypothetical protein